MVRFLFRSESCTVKSRDFTSGNIAISMLLFSLPIVAGEILQNLYNSFDALIVGQSLGYEALAAVNVCGNIATILVNFFNGMSVGASVVVSKAFGSKNVELTRKTVQVAFTFSTILGIVLSILGIVFSAQLLSLAGVRQEYYSEAISYIRIYLAGLLFTVIFNNGAGILRALGDSQSPFIMLCICCVTNISLDILFVKMLGLGVQGAGFATMVAQGISALSVHYFITKRIESNCIDIKCLRIQGKKIVKAVLNVGTAAGIQGSVVAFSNLFLMRYINLFDAISVAGIGVAQKIDRFVILPSKAFGITMTTFVGQNLGAGKADRIEQSKKQCILLAMLITVFLGAVVSLFAAQLVSLFNDEPKVIEIGTAMVCSISLFYWLLPLREVYIGILRGYGNSRMPMILVLIGNVAVRQIFLAVSMASNQAVENIYYSYPIAWFGSSLLVLVYFLLVKNRMSNRE